MPGGRQGDNRAGVQSWGAGKRASDYGPVMRAGATTCPLQTGSSRIRPGTNCRSRRWTSPEDY